MAVERLMVCVENLGRGAHFFAPTCNSAVNHHHYDNSTICRQRKRRSMQQSVKKNG